MRADSLTTGHTYPVEYEISNFYSWSVKSVTYHVMFHFATTPQTFSTYCPVYYTWVTYLPTTRHTLACARTVNCTPMQDKTGGRDSLRHTTSPTTAGHCVLSLSGMSRMLPVSGCSIHFTFTFIRLLIRVLPVLLLLASQVKLRPTLRTGHGGAFRGPGVATCHY